MEKQQNGAETTYKFDTCQDCIVCDIIDIVCKANHKNQNKVKKYAQGICARNK